MICVHKSMLGLQNHLVYDGEKYLFSGVVPKDAWVFGSPKEEETSRSFSEILTSLKSEVSSFPPAHYVKAWKEMRGDAIRSVQWHKALPDNVFQKCLKEALDQLWLIFKDESNSYYFNEFAKERELIQTMSSANVSCRKIKKIIDEEDEIKVRTLRRFTPDETGIAPRTKYSHSSSVTGRLSVLEGPNILTLSKKYRKIFESRHGDAGKILQIDLVSMEPRIALMMANKDAPVDIYSEIMRDVLDKKATRGETKIATLGCLYGMSHFTLEKKISSSLNSRDVLEKIRRYFCIKNLESSLHDEIGEKGFITNFYGRKIFSQDALVNHFIQSTGVDVSLLCFSSLLANLRKAHIEYNAIYVIHDALVIDIKNKDIGAVNMVVEKGLIAPGFSQKFYAKCSEFN